MTTTTTTAHTLRPTRPRLALAIGTGGARAAAALGIAEVLAESGFSVEAFAGCGSGALVAAMLARGLDRDESHALARRVWDPAVSRRPRRFAGLRLFAPFVAGFDEHFALRDDRPIVLALTRAFGHQRLEGLPVPLRVAATDTLTGRPVVLRRGSVAAALRASAATPFLYPGAELDGRRVSDGAQSDPLALACVDDAQVIVSVGFSGTLPRFVDRPALLVAQVGTTLVNNLAQARVEAMRASGRPYLHLEPRFDRHIGRWETDALEDLHQIGRETARRRIGEIRRLVEHARALATLPQFPPFTSRSQP